MRVLTPVEVQVMVVSGGSQFVSGGAVGSGWSTSSVLRGLAAAAAATVLVAGCTASADTGSGTKASGSAAQATGSADAPGRAAVLTISPANGSSKVRPSSIVKVTVADGTLDEVVVQDTKGRSISGTKTDTAWTATTGLKPSAAYTVTAKATGTNGQATSQTAKFDVLTPATTATYHIMYDGETVGIGMPVTIQFDSMVSTRKQRAAVEKAVGLTVSPKQSGAWGWLDARQLMWRPRNYWKPGTRVTVRTRFQGLQTGDSKYVGKSASGGFKVGSAMISTVNIKTHHMTVTKNGKVLRTVPVSTGRPGPQTETRSGTKVIISKESRITMDSTTIGIKKGQPGYYKIDTDYNLRVTWTGEFLHSAPWSVGAQGSANVSHGCTNMAPGNASWMYGISKPGDIVKFVGSRRPFLPTEGIGVWQMSFSKWHKQSALA